MKNLFFVITGIFLTTTTSGCGVVGSGQVTSEVRQVPVFYGVDLRCSANVFITQGDVQEIKVEAEDNILSHITTEVKNNELIIDCKEYVRTRRPVNVYVTVKDLCLVELSGSGTLVTRSSFSCDHMNIRLAGSGDIKAMLSAKSVKATLSGSGNLELSGSASESDIRISGSGNVNAESMKCFESAISISGSGVGRVDVDNDLVVNITGSGNVYYLNEPGHIRSRITGSGEILKI